MGAPVSAFQDSFPRAMFDTPFDDEAIARSIVSESSPLAF
jgi:hypothetical protein